MTAHPRSRGENCTRCQEEGRCPGSSPLTRGKRVILRAAALVTRLIPAHAGKTRETGRYRPAPAAHPRSRGENPDDLPHQPLETGSSPLTRGKLRLVVGRHIVAGLIPAHAGKTGVILRASLPVPAHPRSRGENVARCSPVTLTWGSSPLTRGKRGCGLP